MWHILTSSVKGRSHRRNSAPLQDRTCVLREKGVIAAALADGAGSAAKSQEGADAAVKATCDFLCQNFETLYRAETPLALRRAVLTQARDAVERRARELNVPVRDLACTLMAVAVKDDRYLIIHVGDGVIAYQKKEMVKVASVPCNGEFANNTVFLTSSDALRRCKVYKGVQPELEGFCLMSDGSGAALYNKRKERSAPILKILFQQAQMLNRDVASEILEKIMQRIVAVRTQDDCSVILLTREGSRFGCWARLTDREKAAILGVRTGKRSKRRRQINHYSAEYGVNQFGMNGKEIS